MATIGINLLWLVPGVVGGSEEYTLRLLRAIDPDESRGLRFRMYGQRGLFETHPDLASRFEIRVAPERAASKLGRIGAENSWLVAATRHDDLVHHAGGVVPLVRSQVAVLTIHDLQPLEMPRYFSPAKRRWLAIMLSRSVRAARLVLCPSEFTAERVQTRLGVSPSRVHVVRHGLDEQVPGVVDRAADQRLRSQFGRYLLLPAIAYPHKRHADLVHALDQLRDRFEDLSVVLTGRAGSEIPALDRLTARLGLGDRVHHLGRVPEDELDALYRSAAALVFPSAYEGFGNPVLEAMTRGCPVIASDAAALPEVGGSAVLTVPVGDTVALGDAIARLLTEPGLRDRLRRAGPVQAKRFSSADAADRLLDCYRRALRPAG